MDIRTLSIFVDCMHKRSFAAVAKARAIDPATVTRAINNLEAELNANLFQRTTRRIEPTEQAVSYFERIEPLLEELEEAALEAGKLTQTLEGTLRITCSVSFGLRAILPIVDSFTRMYPGLTLDMGLADQHLDLVSEKVDIAIRHGHPEDSSLVAIKLLDTHYRLCASPAYIAQYGAPFSPDNVADHPALVFNLASFNRRWQFVSSSGLSTSITPKTKMVLSNGLAVHQLTMSGTGIALLPHWLVDKDIEGGTLIDLFPNHSVRGSNPSTAIWALYPSKRYLPRKTRVFLDFLKDHFKQNRGDTTLVAKNHFLYINMLT